MTMLRTLFSFVLSLAITISSVGASTQTSLKDAFDEFNYSISVEWDQKDLGFYENQRKKFIDNISELQAQGTTYQEMIDFLRSQVKDGTLAKDLETAFNMIQINRMSQDEAHKYLLQTINNSYSTGASWNGETGYWISMGVVVIAFAIGIIYAIKVTKEDSGTPTPDNCSWSSYCTPYCSTDIFGRLTCEDKCTYTCTLI
jgi:hypothetical protein